MLHNAGIFYVSWPDRVHQMPIYLFISNLQICTYEVFNQIALDYVCRTDRSHYRIISNSSYKKAKLQCINSRNIKVHFVGPRHTRA